MDLYVARHGAAMRVLHTYFHSLTHQEFVDFTAPNCGLQKYQL